MSESSSGSDDDFAAELEAQMTVAETPAKTPAPPKPAVVIAAPAGPSRRGGLDALLRDAAQKAEVRAFAADAPPAGAAPPRRAVKRRRVPAPSAAGGGAPPSATGRPDPRGGAGGTTASSCPPHPGFLHDICVRCGLRREKPSSAGGGSRSSAGHPIPKSTSMRYIHEGLELSNDELEKAKREEKTRVLLSGKLLLVLDLDHTLLNSARFADLTQDDHDVLGRIVAARACADAGGSEEDIAKAAKEAVPHRPDRSMIDREEGREDADGKSTRKPFETERAEDDALPGDETKRSDDELREVETKEPPGMDSLTDSTVSMEDTHFPGCSPPLKHTYCLRHLALFTKLRPFAHAFLRAASELCQLYIYTMGDKRYAAEMACLLDPGGTLFGGRIISNQESTNARVKDLDIVLGADSAVLIVDDTDRVWPNNLRNLIKVDRYHFFKQSALGFRQPGASVAEKNWRDEGDNGTRAQLRDVLLVIASAHRLFFAGTDASGKADEALRSFKRDEDGEETASATRPHSSRTETSESVDPGKDKDDGIVLGNAKLPDSALETLRSRDVRELLLGGGDDDAESEANAPSKSSKSILPLSNVSVAFSRVTARGDLNPERHPLWLAASSAGADVSADICEASDGKRTKKTTHVVARGDLGEGKISGELRTEKIEWARRNGANAVDAEWLARCAEEWRAVDEAPYSLFSDASNLKEEQATPRDKRGASPGVSA
jgi:RNA polymerase II C-terminal domain phosphatase-like 3/4